MAKEERVEVRLWLPKVADDWFREEWGEDVQNFYEEVFLDDLRADLDADDAEGALGTAGRKVRQVLEREIAKLKGEKRRFFYVPDDALEKVAEKEGVTVEAVVDGVARQRLKELGAL